MNNLKDEQPTEDQVREAIAEIEVAMLENIKAGRAIVEAQEAKKSARFKLLKAKERLNGLEQEFMS